MTPSSSCAVPALILAAQGTASRSTSHDREATGAVHNKGCVRQFEFLSSTTRVVLDAPVYRATVGASMANAPSP